MTPRAVNVVTRWIVLGPFLLWGVWEVALLVIQRRHPEVRLVSQEARSLAARGLPSLAYAMTGLCFHFFQTWKRPPWSGFDAALFAIVWWAGLAVYLVADLVEPGARTWLRYPPIAMLIGGIGAWVCFPQSSIWTP